jgi:ABC-type amino acid transport substrate-binding protein
MRWSQQSAYTKAMVSFLFPPIKETLPMLTQLAHRVLLLMLLLALLSACAPAQPAVTEPPAPTAAPTTKPTDAPVNEIVVRIPDKPSPPFYYQDEKGEWTGLEVEMARALLKEAGYEPKFIGLPWSRALDSMKDGTIQMMMNLSQTEERSQFINWIGPERKSRMILAVRRENKDLPVQTIDDLALVASQMNSKFGIKQDTVYSPEFNERLKDPEFAKWFETVPDELLNPPKVVNGRILGWFQDETMVRYMIATTPEYAELVIHAFALAEGEVYFGFSKISVPDDLVKKLQAAYEILQNNGVFDEIRSREWK